MAGIYIHIPFCKQACNYCDFHFSTNRTLQAEMVAAIRAELILRKDYIKGATVQTLYLGGGTPSLLYPPELDSLLDTVSDNYTLTSDAEITLEANPDDLTESLLQSLRNAGINRLSIGIQSFSDAILRMLNRSHDSRTALDAFRRSREAGFNNISIDLIYAIPGLANTEWEDSLRQALDLAPDHISAYTLTIEPKTVFGHLAANGELIEADEESAAFQMETLIDRLADAGYEQYEVSNFARPGFQSRHNRSYWLQDNYLGVGPGAHSYNGVSRQANISNNHLYLKSLRAGDVPYKVEMLTRTALINEYIMTSLRMNKGCDLSALKRKYDFDLIVDNSEYLQQLDRYGLVILKDSILQLTRKGRLLADKIATDLFVSPPQGESI